MSPSFASLLLPCILISSAWGNPVPAAAPIVVSRQQSLYTCLSSHNVPTKLTTSSDWSTLNSPYNLRLAFTPTAITLPTTAQHVSDAVLCAAAAGVKVQAKSGGHSYASYSSGGKDGSLIVDLQSMNSISVDSATGIATVAGGVRLGNLAVGIYNQGQRALPHGSCPGVGIGGHFTHGGYGYGSRNWGLALDTIVAVDVVLANGTYVHATSTSYPEVYFAVRGAADSFGIVTTFYLQTVSAPATTINFYVGLNSVLSSATTAATAFLKLQNFALNSQYMDRNLNFGIYTDGTTFRISGWYFGDQTYFTNTILPALLQGWPTPDTTRITPYSYLDNLRAEAGEALEQPLTGYNKHDTFYAKSITTRESIPLTSAALKKYFDYIINQGRSASAPWFSIINLYGGKDSQINAKPVGSSAYSDRDSLWVFQNYGFTGSSQPPYDPAITTFIDGLNLALTSAQPAGNFGAYLNYVDPSLTPSQAADLYYGATLYNQLVELKKKLDPNAIFWNPQAIGNANPATSSTTSTKPSSSTSTQSASPTPSLKTSTDGSCGAAAGASCLNSVFGNCCSQYGWCGATSGHCGTGCMPGFGNCGTTTTSATPSVKTTSTSSVTPSVKTSSKSSSKSSVSVTTKTSTTSARPSATLPPSVDGSCGGTTGRTCLNSGLGLCCSQYGWCGDSASYCGTGCKSGFGTCN